MRVRTRTYLAHLSRHRIGVLVALLVAFLLLLLFLAWLSARTAAASDPLQGPGTDWPQGRGEAGYRLAPACEPGPSLASSARIRCTRPGP